MRVSKKLIYANVGVLALNALITWLTITKYFPPMLGLTLFFAFMAGAVWFSLKINGLLPKKKPSYTFHSAPTEKVTTL